MNKTFLQKIKKILLDQKREILKKSGQDIDIDTDGDETDEIQGNIIMGITNQLNARNLEKLAQIEDALKRVDKKSYGKCQDCEEPIPEKRLLINPHALTCVACAEDREAEEKQRKRI